MEKDKDKKMRGRKRRRGRGRGRGRRGRYGRNKRGRVDRFLLLMTWRSVHLLLSSTQALQVACNHRCIFVIKFTSGHILSRFWCQLYLLLSSSSSSSLLSIKSDHRRCQQRPRAKAKSDDIGLPSRAKTGQEKFDRE